ncbi:methyltransferase, partial [Klebsiella pneumoniae]|uniref:methyltransferase n=1 Tax=Klebsiella pneumoniae TaxID=573 RepID=UPI003013F28F
MLDPIGIKPWHFLSEWFKNDDITPFETAHGKILWDYQAENPNFNQVANDAMASDARLISSLVVKECKGVFEGINSLVDVGGATGPVARAITDAFPHLSCTVLDLPHVVANLEGSGNLSYIG